MIQNYSSNPSDISTELQQSPTQHERISRVPKSAQSAFDYVHAGGA